MKEEDNNPANDQSISIKDFLWMCLSRWYWFAISLAVFMGFACYKLLSTPKVYERSTQLLLKDEDSGAGAGSIGNEFSNMGFLRSYSNLNNEMVAMTAPTVMYEVVKRLGLDVGYSVSGRFHDWELYGPSLPLTVSFPELKENEAMSLTATVKPDGSVDLSGFTELDAEGERVPSDKVISLKSLERIDTVDTPDGKLVVSPNPAYVKPETAPDEAVAIKINRAPVKATVARYTGELSTEIPEDTRIISITCRDVNTNRAEDLLNTVTDVYNENWVRDKNRVSLSTAEFIKERLAVIENELGSVDSDISSYKSTHMVPDLAQASQLYFTRASEASDEVLDLNNRLGMARYIRNYLTNSANSFNVLPANAGLQNLSVESQITEYNKLLLSRNNLVENSSASNPLVVDLDSQLAGMRQAILQSIDNYIVTLNASVRAAEASQAMASSRLAANPSQARYLLSVERQQKVKESLYLYLLQKREENELNQAFTAYNSRVITPPTGSDAPVSPNSRNVMLIAFLMGLAVPMGLIWLAETMNTKVRGRKDIENLSVPFLGEIPLGYKRRKGLNRLRPARPEETDRRVIMVRKGSGNTINEAFRVIRTNLELMVDAESTGAHTLMVTSANPGSGKTFITMNLATILAIKGKKVAIVDLDLRKASLSTFVNLPQTGMSAYLSGHATPEQIRVRRPVEPPKHPENFKDKDLGEQYVDIYPVGALPPNPVELLYSPRLKAMLDDLRQQYDYVLLDCPPVEVVADAKIINRHADMTIFVIRAGVLEREILPHIQEFYDNQRYHNMAIILNGTDQSHLGPLRSRYGYGYGYGYGYHKKE